MTRILVTGGAGYVGSVSVEALLAAGHEVVVLDDATTGHPAAVPEGARFHQGTYTDQAYVAGLLADERIEAILHCAARSLVGESGRDPAKYYRDNVAGGVALLEAARTSGVGRIVFSSTAAVYGVPDATPIPEDAVLRPINPYGETKRTFEGALRWYGAAYGLRSVSLRYFNVGGATEALGEDHDPETHLIPAMLAAAEGRAPLTVFGDDYPTPDGTCIRDYIHVADLADAHLRGLEATTPGRSAHGRAAHLQPGHGRRLQRPRGARRRRARRRAARSRSRSVTAAPAIRRSSSRATIARGRSWAGRRTDPASTRSSGPPGPGASATRTATRTERSASAAPAARSPARAGPAGRRGPAPARRRPHPSPPSRRGPARSATAR